MKCPRCGSENKVPEATEHRCFQCGFVLIGEVARPTDDIRNLARRQALWRFLAVVIIIAGVGYAWTQQWFGLIGAEQTFEGSDQPALTPMIAAPPLQLPVGTAEVSLLRDGAWYVDAVVLATHEYTDDTLAPVAPLDLVVGWGVVPTFDRTIFSVQSGSRSAFVTTDQSDLDADMLGKLVGLIRPLTSDADLMERLKKLKPGTRVGIRGFLVSGVYQGEPLKSAAATKNSSASYVVYLASIVINGKTFVPATPPS